MPKISTPTLQRDAASGVIYIHWTEPTEHGKRGRSRRASTGTREMAAAKVFLGQWLLEDQTQPQGPAFTVSELWALYDERHVQKHVVGTDSSDFCWKNLEPHFGGLALAQVTQGAVDAYLGKRLRGEIGRPSVAGTVRGELQRLMACFRWCASPKRKPPIVALADVPMVDLPPPSEPRDRWLREDELTKLLTAAADYSREGGNRLSRVERFLWLALSTAGRKTALCELTWPRVDFDTNVIDQHDPGRTRTSKRRSAVPISKALRPVLLRAYEERQTDHVLDHDGEIIHEVYKIAERAGVPDVSPHVLRHTAATHMARRGVPLWVIAKVLGNTLAMVEKVYAKHCPDDLRPAVDTIFAPVLLAPDDATACAQVGRKTLNLV